MAAPRSNPMDRPDLDFSEDEVKEIAADIETLTRTPEWATYGRVVKEAISAARAQGFADREKIDYWAGFVEGLLYVWAINEEMKAQVRRLLAREEAEGVARKQTREKLARRQATFDDGDLSL